MPKWVKFAGMWIVSATIAVGLSWVAVSQVRDRVVEPNRVVPSTVASESVVPTTVEIEQTTVPVASSGSTTAQATPGTAFGASTTVATRGGTTTSTRPASGSTQATTTSTTTATTTTTIAPPVVAPPSGATSTHNVAGGTVTIRATSPDRVDFVSAIPKSGFTTELRESGPERVRVRFRSGEQTSEFEAEWDNGQLQISLDESDD